MQPARNPSIDYSRLAAHIKSWGQTLGFQQVGITDTRLDKAEAHLLDWLHLGRHGEMAYMAEHGTRRSRPGELVTGTIRVISVRMNYLHTGQSTPAEFFQNHELGLVSRYAWGRDYHKLLRRRLQKLADGIAVEVGDFGYRVFSDSAPVLEKPLAQKAGLGWIGKHTNLLSREAGSWYFLGEIYTDLPLPIDRPAKNHCGRCQACIDVCPAKAIIAPYRLDARRCISYLTIELHGSIPEPLRPLMGQHIYGCDDCQLACPWNRFAQPTEEPDFAPRHGLNAPRLVEVCNWSKEEFQKKTAGSAIRRLGHERWLRNIAVALGNTPANRATIEALKGRRDHPSALVREHVGWALARHGKQR